MISRPDRTWDRIVAGIAVQLGIEVAQITPSARIVDDLGADSVDVIELWMAAEEEFHLEIPDKDADRLQTVGKLHAYLQRRLSSSG